MNKVGPLYKLLIVDGNNVASLAWFVGNRSGFFNMVLKAIGRLMPTHLAMVFDANGPGWRHALYPGYKAGRGSDDGRREYINDLVLAVRDAGIQTSRIGEADDVIATLATNMASRDLHVYVLSNDQDMLALPTDNITVVSWKGGFNNFVHNDPERVMQRLGVRPDMVADYKALMGDPSDNISGVPGVGPARARAALAAHGDVTGILNAMADGLYDTGKIPVWAKKVRADLNSTETGQMSKMELSYKLATMRTDACVPIDPEKYRCNCAALVHAAATIYKG